MLYFFKILNSEEGWDCTQPFLYVCSHISCPQAVTHLPCIEISEKFRCSGLTGVLMLDLWGLSEEVFLFNLQTHGPHKCFFHCPLQSIKEILPFVSTISGIPLVTYELCPPICAFQYSHLCDLFRKECCLQRGRPLIQSNPPCDFIMQGTKPIVLLSTNESSSEYCSLCCSCDQQITCELLEKQNAIGKKSSSKSSSKKSNLNASPHHHCI